MSLGKIAVALGALLAYQNRDKIGDMLRGNRDPNAPSGGGMLETLTSGGGLQDILDRFRGAGSDVNSWVGKDANAPLQPDQVRSAIDSETLDQLSAQTGLSRDELIERITRDVPSVVDQLTPDGRLPEPVAPRTEGIVASGGLLDEVPPLSGKTQA